MPPEGWQWCEDNEPPDDAVVVRGGVFDAPGQKRTLRSAEKDHEDEDYASFDIYPVSVLCAIRDDDEEWGAFLCRLSTEGQIRNKQLRWTTVGKVKQAGFRLFRSPPPPSHLDIDLGSVDQASLDRLIDVLGPPEENPCPSKD